MITGQPQLLATKILPPRPAPGVINRPRLVGLVEALQTKQVAVIKAPAGFGKSSLASAWAERLRQSGNAIAWLALEPDDDEPTRFLFYVAHALRRACADMGKAATDLILETSLIQPHMIVSTLVNELADVEEDVFLFVDDYHCITHPDIHDALSFLLKHAPTQFHLIVGTRVDPPLPLARLRAQNQLLEIDVSALRFDLNETRQFLEREKFVSLDPATAKLLHDKTEGWPAVLRIVASTSMQTGQELGRYVRGLSAALRPIGAYLAEMLDGLPSDMAQFMLRTAILDRLSAPLCQAVTGIKSSHHLLKSMEARQLMLAPLDQEGSWYRYHPLLAGHLLQKLDAELADEIPWLHRRAYNWYAAHELWTDAVQHAIAAGDTEQAASWIDNCAMTLVKRGDMLTLLSWQRLFPSDLMRGQIKLRLAIAWGMALAMRFEEALDLVADIERDIGTVEQGQVDVLKCECLAIRSVALALADDSQAALSLAQPCMRESTDPWTANVASNVARFGLWKAGDLKSFYATPWIPYSLDEDKWNVFASVYRLCLQGLVELQQLRLPSAERCFLEGMRLAQQHVGPSSAASALPASLIAAICYEQGRLDDAEAMIIDRVPIIGAAGMLECAASAYTVLARIAVCRQNADRAYALLDQAEALAHARKWGRLAAIVYFLRLRLFFQDARIVEGSAYVERLERLAAEYPAPARCAWSGIHHLAARGRAYLASAENRPNDATAILKTLGQEAETTDRRYHMLLAELQLCIALQRAKASAEASTLFHRVLRAAKAGGMFQTMLDEGPQIGTLLLDFQETARRTGQSNELLPYVERLLDGWRPRYQVGHASPPTSAVTESLSPRERDILKLIARGQSNKEIARVVGIAPETVKTHVKNIFVKLSVEKRAQAVSRAQSLGLVSSHLE